MKTGLKSVNESVNVLSRQKGPFVHGERGSERSAEILPNHLNNLLNRVNEKRNERTLLRVSFVHGRSIGGTGGNFLNGGCHGS